MTGRPRGAQTRSGRLELRLTPDEEARLDRKRGTSTRSAYLRRFINDELPHNPVAAPPLERPLPEPTLQPEPVAVVTPDPVIAQASPRPLEQNQVRTTKKEAPVRGTDIRMEAGTSSHWHRRDIKTKVCPVCGRWP